MIKLILKYLPSIVIPTIASIILTMIYGTNLSPDDYGFFSLFTTSISIVTVILFNFMITTVLRFYRVKKEENQHVTFFSTFLLTSFLITVIVFLVTSVFIGMKIGLLFSISLLVSVFLSFYLNQMRSTDKHLTFNLFKAIIPSLNVLFVLYLTYSNNLNMWTVIFAMYIPMSIVVVIYTVKTIKKSEIKFKYNIRELSNAASYGFPLALAAMLNTVISGIDRYIINFHLNNHSVGIYSFAYRIAELSMINLTLVIILALYPQLIKIHDTQGRARAEHTLNEYLKLHIIITIPFVILVWFYGEEIISLIFHDYVDSAKILKYMILGAFLLSLSYYTNKSFELTKTNMIMVRLLALAALVNIILTWFLVPYYHLMGAIIATFVSYFVYVVFSIISARNILKVHFPYKLFALVSAINIIIVFIFKSIINNPILIEICLSATIVIFINGVLGFILYKRKVLNF
ncbi:lipopolysaccharide biosynthesis protein [Halalkalibacterium halodurans]|uniref:lipopolysaccharide biosynthesis protein n=1 Tax=Halalkalibacterium halodurans TaxID=86665 RepID=UPI002AA9E5EB|nr:oligosaccharide flippase family protein [Halalkalibacterium halodurans]MDY7224219.1 oligosaccharide flippase family protein [Halalkalibacterium halodurans]MDY7243504.1 oligosaccharide flippase family protein [Halalkalibacterium halodurans]MED4123431.1 oligosaccharide flippase family protein [Halalkalibacterium halodurans]